MLTDCYCDRLHAKKWLSLELSSEKEVFCTQQETIKGEKILKHFFSPEIRQTKVSATNFNYFFTLNNLNLLHLLSQ